MFEDVHQSWQPFWPQPGNKVLDVGAGSGRDAKWCSLLGCETFAIEPANALRQLGKKNTCETDVCWLDDTLPDLKKVTGLGIRFDLILVSAVWMHISPSARKRVFRKLANLLSPNGKLVITLRHGSFNDERLSYGVSTEELEKLAKDYALHLCHKSALSEDVMGRSHVQWQTAVFNLPDDGSGDLTKIRHIIVNDNKSATYKLALLRTLIRIADAHPGSVLDKSDGKVSLPLGLVALYWIRQFKRLIDIEIDGIQGIQQNRDSGKELGFVKEKGWYKLKHLSADDLAIGAMFIGDDAIALHNTIKDT